MATTINEKTRLIPSRLSSSVLCLELRRPGTSASLYPRFTSSLWSLPPRPEQLGVSDKLWRAFAKDFSRVYWKRLKILLALVVLVGLSLCLCLFHAFPAGGAMVAMFMILILFTGLVYYEQKIPAILGGADDLSAFQAVCDRFSTPFASHGLVATVIQEDSNNLYWIVEPLSDVQRDPSALYFV